jgi:hypothetical protein
MARNSVSPSQSVAAVTERVNHHPARHYFILIEIRASCTLGHASLADSGPHDSNHVLSAAQDVFDVESGTPQSSMSDANCKPPNICLGVYAVDWEPTTSKQQDFTDCSFVFTKPGRCVRSQCPRNLKRQFMLIT